MYGIHSPKQNRLYIPRTLGSSLLPIIVPKRSQREILPSRHRLGVLPIDHHLPHEHRVAYGGEEVTPPDEAITGLLACRVDSYGTPEERVEDGKGGQVAGGAKTMVGCDLGSFREDSEGDGTRLQS